MLAFPRVATETGATHRGPISSRVAAPDAGDSVPRKSVRIRTHCGRQLGASGSVSLGL